MSTILIDEMEAEETAEKDQHEVDETPYQEILSLPNEKMDRILAEEQQSRPKLPPDPCLLENSSEDDDQAPITEYQDSMEAAGYPYW